MIRTWHIGIPKGRNECWRLAVDSDNVRGLRRNEHCTNVWPEGTVTSDPLLMLAEYVIANCPPDDESNEP